MWLWIVFIYLVAKSYLTLLRYSHERAINYPPFAIWCNLGFLVAQTVKNLPAMWKTRVRSLGWEDSLEKGDCLEDSMDRGAR